MGEEKRPTTTGAAAEFRPVRVRSVWFWIVTALIGSAGLITPVLYAWQVYGYSNLEYRIEESELVLRFGWKRERIPLGAIATVDVVERPARMRRTRGTGLPTLQEGRWRHPELGPVYRLTTGRPHVVIRDDDGEHSVISPADAAGFVAALERARAARAAGEAVAARVYGPVRSGPHVAYDPLLLLALIMTVVPVFGILAWLIRARQRLAYRVDELGIAIRHAFRSTRIPWDRIRSIRRVDEKVRGWRTMGTAMPGFYSGWFKLRGIGPGAAYATRLSPPTVLVELRYSRYLLSPEDPDAFIAAAEALRPASDG